jgi:transcriptional regulator GlxA family with amidase domain
MNQPVFGQLLGAQLIPQLLVDLALNGAPMKPLHQHLDPRVATALQTIHDHYQRDLAVTELARAARLSTVQFRKLFQRHVHASPKHYLLQHRLKHAARLLRASPRTAKEIAFATGFNSEAYFHRCFRQAYGCTPLDYRATRRQSV